jgi:hypothetical protein
MTPTASPPASPGRPRSRKLLLSLLIVGLLGGVAAVGSYSAFSATTTNANNRITTGTVAIGNNYASPLYSITNAKPGDSQTHCITITYTGSLAAAVHLYMTSSTMTVPADNGKWNLRIDYVTGATDNNCTGAVVGANVYNADLATWATSHTDWASGVALDDDTASATWNNNSKVQLKFTATQNDVGGSGGLDSGTHTFTWEAQST